MRKTRQTSSHRQECCEPIAWQRGFVLLPVVLAITLIATIAFMLNNQSAINVDITVGETDAKQADYLVQAGMAHALWGAQNSGCAGDMTMTTVPFGQAGTGSYTATVTTPAGATTAYPNLAVDQDAWFRSDNITLNNGTGASHHLRMQSGNLEYVVVRFDLSSLPAGAQINSATARFYVKATKGHPEGPVTVHRATADWTETGATWENMSSNYDSAVLDTIPAQPAAGDVWVTVNLTAQVQAWVNGGLPNYGIMLIPIGEGTHAEYISREGVANQRPHLDVIVGTGPASPMTITATGTLTGNPSPANDITRTLDRTAITVSQPNSHTVLQPGAASGEDAYIWEWSKNSNYGTADETWVASTPPANNTALALFRFDMSALPQGAKILNASLSLYHRDGNDPDVPVTAHRIAQSWDEQFVTWNRRDNGIPWNTAGGDFDAAAVATTNVGPASSIRYEWDITSLVQGWVNGTYKNHGVALRTVAPSIFGERFDTSDHADPTRHPRLSIAYACECGSPCLAPQGHGNVLMVVYDKDAMKPSDVVKQALFESWGYTVNLISGWDVDWDFATQAVSNDVAYVSETVDPTSFGLAPKLAATSLGVINEEGALNDELGMATNSSNPVGSSINVTDTSHYITAAFASGPLEIYAAAMEQLTVSGAEALGLQTLADTGGAGALVVLDTGAVLEGGGTSPGRRVMLPLGRDANFNWDYLNSNGRLLVQRALQWGTGNTGAVPAQKILLVVGNPASLTSKESDKKALIESWDYTVNLIDESDSQANFDAAIAANDVAYIPQDINSTNLGTKLANASIGVVNEEGEQVVELGFASGKLFKSRHEIDVVDNSHYITQTFATGLLTFVSSDQSVHMLSSSLAPGLSTLAKSFNVGSQWEPSLATLDAGDVLYGGGNAAGRRVELPWGGGTFNINLLTDDGRTIMQRALEWAAGAGAATLPIAHWKFDEGTGPTAFDSVGGNDATLNGSPTWTTGTLGDALDFDGSSDYITTDSNFTPPPVGTVTFWMQVSGSPAAHGRILGLDDTWEIRHVTTGTPDGIPYGLVFDLGVSGVNTEFVTTTTVDTPGQWYHIAASYDTTNDAYAVYIDGVPHKSGTYPSALSVPAANLLSIGTRTGSTNYFDGVLDDVRVYDQFLSAAEIAALAASGAGGGGGPTGVVFEGFTEAALSNGTSLTINKPTGTAAGDLLIAAVTTDGSRAASLNPPAGWNVVNIASQGGQVTFGVWWKLAGTSEPGSYAFTWSGSEHAYGWVMRFTGHDPASPVDANSNDAGSGSAPSSPAVTTTVDNALILRLGGFDDDDITTGAPGLAGHTAINMNDSGNGSNTASGGSGYVLQPAAGDSGTSTFSLTATEEYRAVTIGIAPAP